MKRFALIGYPLGHTMSPPIHKKLFALSGVKGSYEAVAIEPERFEEALPKLMQLDGFNITIPYKQKIIPHCKKLHETAARYGAVNVLDCRTGIGYNTDCVGFLQSLQGIGLEGEVLICGAGGVGSRIHITNPTRHSRHKPHSASAVIKKALCNLSFRIMFTHRS